VLTLLQFHGLNLVPWTELYLTLQQKIVDGQENPLANLWEVKMYEVQKYASLTGHIYDPMPLVADLKWFNSLTPKQQSIIEKGAILAQNYSRFVNSAREEELARLLTEKGMVINDVSTEEKARMRDASQAKVVEAIKKKLLKKLGKISKQDCNTNYVLGEKHSCFSPKTILWYRNYCKR